MAGCKHQLIMKYYSKFLVSNICHINIITYIQKIAVLNINSWLDFLLRNIDNNWQI